MYGHCRCCEVRAFLAGVGAELLSAPDSYFFKEKTGVFKTNLLNKIWDNWSTKSFLSK